MYKYAHAETETEVTFSYFLNFYMHLQNFKPIYFFFLLWIDRIQNKGYSFKAIFHSMF